jgi:tRNA wybutosine-synthesizing protein 3
MASSSSSSSSSSEFAQRKAHVCAELERGLKDKSPKGFLDAPILDLVQYINRVPQYYTTSSCSGRITMFCSTRGGARKGGKWILIEHGKVRMSPL